MTHMEHDKSAEEAPDIHTVPDDVPNAVPVENTTAAEDDHPVAPKRRMNPVLRGFVAVMTALGVLFLAAFLTDLGS